MLKERLNEKNKKFTEAITTIRNIRTVFKDSINKAADEYNNSLMEIQKNYRPDSNLAKKATNEAKEKRDNYFDECKNDMRGTIKKVIEDVRIHELASVRVLSGGSDLDKLRMLSDMKLSEIEFRELSEQFGGKSHWTDRYLLSLAEKSGLKSDLQIVDIDTRLKVLEDLEEAADSFIDCYDGGDTRILDAQKISDHVLLELSEKFTAGAHFKDEVTEAVDAATRINHTTNLQERGLALANEIKNASSTSVQNRILGYLFDTMEFDTIAKYAGSNAFDIAKNEHDLMIEAGDKASKILSLDVPGDAKAGSFLYGADSNPYLMDELHKRESTNSTAGAVSDIIANAKLKDSQNNNTKEIDDLKEIGAAAC